MKVTITQIDTACMLIDINGFRIVTDPAFDAAGNSYDSGGGRILNKTGSPALPPAGLTHTDLVLLSHDQHKDNLDNAGREFIKTVPRIISTREARARLELDTVTGIDEWETVAIDTDKVPGLRITGTPAQHASTLEMSKVAGHVLGFILEWEGQEQGALYISGDTVYFDGIEQIASRFKIDTAILHIGKAGFPALIPGIHLTFTAAEAIKAAKLFNVKKMIPTHMEGWEHFQESATDTHTQIKAAGLEDKLVWLTPGKPSMINI